MIASKITVFLFAQELWRFNLASRRWQKLKTFGAMPVELASHSAMVHGNHLVLFGGTGVPFGEAASNQLHVCNLPSLRWSHVICTGQLPICIYGHTMNVIDNSLYVFGGTTGWEYNSDLHRLDLDSFEWDTVDVSGVRPNGRYRHEVATVGSDMFVFGGGRSTEVCILQLFLQASCRLVLAKGVQKTESWCGFSLKKRFNQAMQYFQFCSVSLSIIFQTI